MCKVLDKFSCPTLNFMVFLISLKMRCANCEFHIDLGRKNHDAATRPEAYARFIKYPAKNRMPSAVILEAIEDGAPLGQGFSTEISSQLVQKVRTDIKAGRIKKMGIDEL